MIRSNPLLIRAVLATLAIAFCLFLIQATARIGFSRLLSRYALISDSISSADQAIRFSPSDPDAHRARAWVFNRLRMPAEAAKSLERATSLRYRDDYLWLELGNTREEIGDTQGALVALDQAVRWAPYYAHTHWHRGNLLLRMNRSPEAFVELRQAAAINRDYLPGVVDLAWGISRGESKATEQLLDIRSDAERLAFIRLLAKRGKGREVLDQVRLLSIPLSYEDKNEFSRLLFSAKAFRDAFELWADAELVRTPSLFNGGFEESPVVSHAGFGGWMLAPEQGKTKLAIDLSEKSAGRSSLQITFNGPSTPGTSLLSQAVLVDPSKRYRISFKVKAKDLVTGGLPVLTVHDAASDQLIGRSNNFPSATSGWIGSSFEFVTLVTSEAAVIRLHRNDCEPRPCPIFGTLWLDEIAIEQLK